MYALHSRFLHVWRHFAGCSRCFVAKFLHRSSVGSLLRARCWLGQPFLSCTETGVHRPLHNIKVLLYLPSPFLPLLFPPRRAAKETSCSTARNFSERENKKRNLSDHFLRGRQKNKKETTKNTVQKSVSGA